jgi:DNA-binding IclR family transcriptional regulator
MRAAKQKVSSMNVKTAERTMRLFETFAQEARPLSLSELGRLLTIPVSSCFALIRTFENAGYIYEVRRRGGYYPTKRLLVVTQKIAASDPLLDRLEPTLSRLRDETGETVVVAKLQGTRVVYLDVFESRQTIRYSPQIGDFRDPHANSLGKALLATLDPETRQQLLNKYHWKAYTKHTIVSQIEFESQLKASAKKGWFSNLGEGMVDIAGVACVLMLEGEPYAISVAGPFYRMEPRIDAHAKSLLATRDTIARRTDRRGRAQAR